VVVDLLPGVDVDGAFRRLDRAHPLAVQDESLPVRPAAVARLAQFGRLPGILAGLLALIALLTLTYLLTSALGRRRRDLTVLRCLGLTQRETGTTMAWMSCITTAVALIAGIPLGVALGALAWQVVAARLSLDTGIVQPPLLIAGFIATSMLAALVVSMLPARAAARYRPATELRIE
jgi:ABC-type lipoprotein release transport system permease subunit